MKDIITFDDFLQVELRVGKIIKAESFPKARNPSYILHVDFGESLGIRKSSAQITKHYTIESLEGKMVVAVINFPKKQIGSIQSECLITGFHDENNDVVLCVPDANVPLGTKLL
jgi:tRNA-binding protein